MGLIPLGGLRRGRSPGTGPLGVRAHSPPPELVIRLLTRTRSSIHLQNSSLFCVYYGSRDGSVADRRAGCSFTYDPDQAAAAGENVRERVAEITAILRDNNIDVRSRSRPRIVGLVRYSGLRRGD